MLAAGWEVAASAPGAFATPAGVDALEWLPATVPGTAAGALRDAGRWNPGDAYDFDAQDWWFRVRFATEPVEHGEQVTLCFDGVATLHEVFLNGVAILAGESMFATASADVTERLQPENELVIVCRALGPVLATPRKPRARWRQGVVDGNLRWHRTMLLGRAPGFAAGPAAVGPWRAVRLERRNAHAPDVQIHIWTELDGTNGVVGCSNARVITSMPAAEPLTLQLSGPSGTHAATALRLTVPDVTRWWPHTHGEPVLHDVRVIDANGVVLHEQRVGFCEAAAGPKPGHDVERDGLDLHVNGVRVFARGAVWTPIDPVGLAPSPSELRAALEQLRDGGMNLVRVVGTAHYESAAFHDLCDELGIMVWQDFMFANMDYPVADPDFSARVRAEASTVVTAIGRRPSTVVFCGNSEIEQQVGMLGLDPAIGRGELFGQLLPDIVGSVAIYVPSAPCGGELPFRADAGVANYFGVGGYRRPLTDARHAGVRFASECLALANVPDDATLAAILPATGDLYDDPRWKLAVASDQGTDWDFDDVRDHYLRELFAVDPQALRRGDPQRFLALSRQVSGEVMAEVFGEWRRAASPCGGGIVLWLRDLLPGAGWGLIDAHGQPKVAYHHLRRALAPVATWFTDEGLNGLDVHIANDRPEPLAGRLRVALYRDGEQSVAEALIDVEVPPHGTVAQSAEAVIGRFVDAAYAYRFGPPPHDTVVVTLEARDGHHAIPLAQAFRFPAGRPEGLVTPEELGLTAQIERCANGTLDLHVAARRLVYGLRVVVPGFRASDDAFSIEPGHARRIVLTPFPATEPVGTGSLTAINLRGAVPVTVPTAGTP